MFRNGMRLTVRVAGAQQKRTFSSPSANTNVAVNNKFLFYAVASVSAVAISIACTEPSQAAFFSTPLDVKKFKSDVSAAIDADESKRGDGTSIGPTLVRLAWHASGTYSIFDKTGGSNGATMRFEPESAWGANAGLKGAREFVEAIKKKHQISTADAWTLAGGKNYY